jgi:hypothetical protein
MRKHYFFSSLVIFMAGFALSVIIDGRRLVSSTQGTLSNSLTPGVAAQTTRQPSILQRWEYRVVTRYTRSNQADMDFELNRLGEQGYEICGVVQSGASADGVVLTVTLRRPR